MQKKLHIFELLQKGSSVSFLATQFGVSISTVRRIHREGNCIADFGSKGSQNLCRKNRRRALFEDLESRLYAWFLKARARGDPVTDVLVQDKALELSKEFGTPQTFNANRGWLYRFKQRHNIRSICNEGESTDREESSGEEESSEEEGIQSEKGMNGTGFVCEYLPSITSVDKAENRVDSMKIKKEKEEHEGDEEKTVDGQEHQKHEAVDGQRHHEEGATNQRCFEEEASSKPDEQSRRRAFLAEEKQKDLERIDEIVRKWGLNMRHVHLQSQALKACLELVDLPDE